MKKILILITALSSVLYSCSDDNDTLTGNKNTGGLVSVKNALVGYVVGNGDDFNYSTELSTFQGNVKVESVNVYKQFFNIDGDSSQKVLLKTVDFPLANQVENIIVNFNFNELISGLSVNGAPMSTSDTDLNIGDYWVLSFESNTSTGDLVGNVGTTKVSVGTRFAGNYACIDALYFRLGVLTYDHSGWPAETVIESVNASTYKVNEYFGPFSGNEFYFTIDGNDVIDYPATSPSGDAQLGNGQPFITCSSNPGDMTHVNCGNSNFVVRDNVDGKDKLYMSFGYYTTGSGPREFYQVMEKIVE